MPLARSLAARYRDRGEPLDDLIQVAYLGLVKAARQYRPGAGQNFPAYAVPTMNGELRRYFRDHGWDVRPPRRLQELRARARRTEEELRQDLGREPRPAELAERLEISDQELRELRVAAEGYCAYSLDAPPLGVDPHQWTGDALADVDTDQEDAT